MIFINQSFWKRASKSTNEKPTKDHQKATNKNVNKNEKEKKYSVEILEFYNEIIDFFPKKTQPKTDSQRNSWLGTIDKLQNKENYSLPEIKKIIKHFRQDLFWAKNFLSLNKLRIRNKEGVLFIDYFAEKIKQVKPDCKVNSIDMQNTLEDPDRLKL